MIPFSVLDLSPVPEGSTSRHALANTLDIARHAERWGFRRFWLAEHHNSTGIASAATAVVIGHVAAGTATIRVGAGGIMLPNHAPLVIAEQFGTLATLYPGRIDLGLGRAPGTDMQTARALRRNLAATDSFPADVAELIGYFRTGAEAERVRAIPGAGTEVPVWVLGSSLYGAQLAAWMGLPYAFASHFAPQDLEPALAAYRQGFRPQRPGDTPYAMLAVNVFGAETDAEAARLRTSMQLAFANLRSGRPGPLPHPVDDIAAHLDAAMLRMVDQALSVQATGSPATVRRHLGEIVNRYQPDEVMLTAQIHDHTARLQSFRIAADAMAQIGAAQAA